jgi:hypothetical protein
MRIDGPGSGDGTWRPTVLFVDRNGDARTWFPKRDNARFMDSS